MSSGDPPMKLRIASQLLAFVFASSGLSKAATISFTASDDTMLMADSQFTTANNGGTQPIAVGTFVQNSTVTRDLFRFDVSSLAGNYQSIQSVTFQLYVLGSAGSPQLSLHLPVAANAAWVEGSAESQPETGASSWEWRIGGSPGTAWVGGPGLGSTGYGAPLVTVDLSANYAGPVSFTISDPLAAESVVQAFLGSTNPGFLLKNTNELLVDSWAELVTSEEFFVEYRPTLIVNYTPVPEPAGWMLSLGGLLAWGIRRQKR